MINKAIPSPFKKAIVGDPHKCDMIDFSADNRYVGCAWSKFKIHRYSKHGAGSRFMLELTDVSGFIHVDAIERRHPK